LKIGVSLVAAVLVGCTPAAQAFRLNPEQTPERYRVTCKGRFLHCEQKVRQLCDSDYQIVERHSNMPEQPEASQSDLSSTGPSSGPVAWDGELTVVCGKELPPIRLVREAVSEAPVPTQPVSPAAAERVCIPGVTQACLGPGACAGAQACTAAGDGYGACDCGPQPLPAASVTHSASAAPKATP
jgi:hypothetical protein